MLPLCPGGIMQNSNINKARKNQRRNFLKYLIATGTTSSLLACGSKAQRRERNLNNPLLWAVAWKQTAAEYGALCHQAFNLAKLRVEMAIESDDGEKPLAIITDMDDTVIHAASYWGYLIKQGKDFFDDKVWDDWLPNNLITAVPGSLDFLRYCAENNVEIFYVTNRDQGERTYEYALDQLKSLNFPYADKNHLTVYRDTSDKMPTKLSVSKKYNLVLMLGDNLNDYKRDYYVKNIDQRYNLMEKDNHDYGNKFIVLPNPTDGHWVRAIFGESEPLPNDDNRSLLFSAATRVSWNGK